MELRVGFWNARGKRPELLEQAGSVVQALVAERSLDVLALVEVEPGAMPSAGDGWSGIEVTDAEGRSRWDAAVLFKQDAVEVVEHRRVVKLWNERRLRIAVDVELRVRAVSAPLRLLISHWPSPSGGAVDHATYVRGLHELAAPNGAPERATVLMGDYNVEPIDRAYDGLDATRDRALASRRPSFFYNLAWRWLGTWSASGAAGTYRYPADPHTHWRTFDQVLVSTHLLREGPLRLLDGEVVERAGEHDIVGLGFDHLPVVAAFQARDTAREEASDG